MDTIIRLLKVIYIPILMIVNLLFWAIMWLVLKLPYWVITWKNIEDNKYILKIMDWLYKATVSKDIDDMISRLIYK